MNLKQKLMYVLELDTYAEKMGFDKTFLIPADNIVLDERVRMQCQVNLCGHYNRNLMCPPYMPSLSEIGPLINKYKFALLVQLQRDISARNIDDSLQVFNNTALELHEMLTDLEKKAFSLGFPLALALGAGECKLCRNCVVENGENQCRKPGLARPSMEAMGINVVQTCRSAGLSMDFSEHKLTIAGLLLID